MGRGLGNLQREILRAVARIAETAKSPSGKPVGLTAEGIHSRLRDNRAADPRSVRRALATLEVRGYLIRMDSESRGDRGWFKPILWTTAPGLRRVTEERWELRS